MAELAEGFGFDLADALAGDVELLAHLFQGAGAAVLDAEAQLEHLLLPGGEGREDLYQLLLQQGEGGGLRRLAGVLIGDEVAQMAVLLLADGGLQGDGLLGDLQDLTHPLHRHGHLLGDLLGGGVVAQLLEQLAGDADDLVDGLHHVDGDADGAGLVGDGPGDGLADPPGGVGRELKALGEVELLHGLDQAQVALLDQVQELHAPAHIPLGDGHHQTQVGLGQALLGPLAPLDGLVQLGADLVGDLLPGLLHLLQLFFCGGARAHVLGQGDLLLRGEQIDFADLLQIHAHRVIRAEGVHHGVGVHQLLVGDLLHGLQGGLGIVGQLGDVVLAHGVDAQVLQSVIDLVHLLGVQIHVLQHVQQLGGGQVAFLLAPLDQLVPLPQPLDLGGCPRGPGEIRLFRCHQQAGDVIILPEGLDLKLQGLDGPGQGGAGPLEHGHGALHPLLPVAGHHLSPDKEVGAPHREQGEGQQDEDGPPQQLLGAQPAYQRDAIHIPSLSFSTVFYHASRSQTSRTTSRVSTTKNMGRITFAPPFRASPAPTHPPRWHRW